VRLNIDRCIRHGDAGCGGAHESSPKHKLKSVILKLHTRSYRRLLTTYDTQSHLVLNPPSLAPSVPFSFRVLSKLVMGFSQGFFEVNNNVICYLCNTGSY